MSLVTDKVFYDAIKSSETLMSATKGRVYSTSIPLPDDKAFMEPTPYIIITFDELANEGFSKDNDFEGDTDRVKIGIEITAADRETLADLAIAVRKAVIGYFTDKQDEDQLIPYGYTLTSSAVNYDPYKPCFYQTLGYLCDTRPD